MAAAVGRFCKPGLLQPRNGNLIQQVGKFSTTSWTKGHRKLVTAIGALTGGVGALVLTLDHSVRATDLTLHPPKNIWSHTGTFAAFDHASLRRGYEVYKQVCAACHSMRFMAYRNLVDVTHTEAEAKAEAEEVLVQDGPDDQGNYFNRPGKLSDIFPNPYANEEAARAANNGAFPPDLSYITSARHGGEDYIFSLLTGYYDPPAGIVLRDGQYYNAYFPGGAIGMAKALYDEVIEYSDGTPATASQLAKDVSAFLKWCAEPEHDTRKLWLLKSICWFSLIFSVVYYMKRLKWSSLKSRKIIFHKRQPPLK